MVFTSRVLQIVIPLVVKHLVGGQVHCSIQQLKYHVRKVANISFTIFFFSKEREYLNIELTVNPESSQPRPQKMRASMRPMM